MKKSLGKIFFAAVFAAAFSVSAAGLAYADADGAPGYVSADFEKFEVGQTFTSDPESGVISIETANDLKYEIVDDNGDKVMKITREANGKNNFGIKLIPVADVLDDADYWVVKYDLKNGDKYPFVDYNGGTFGNEFPYINQQLQFRNDGESIMFGSNNRISFTPYTWHEYIFIGNPKTGKIRLVLDGNDIGETNCDRIGSVGEFFGIQLYDVNSGRPYEHVMYVDDMEIFGFDFEVGCELDGTDAVVPSDTIELTAKGYVDTAGFDGITISSDKDSDISVTEHSYDAESGKLTLKLSHEMKSFTTYTVDYSSVKCKIPAISGGTSATFKTTGNIDTECELTVNGDNKLSAGANEAVFKVKNVIDTPAPLCIMLELVEGGKTTAIGYKDVTLEYGDEETVTAFFRPASDEAVIKAYVKNAVNGTAYYSDLYTANASGVQVTAPETISEKYPIVNADSQKGFYSLKLGTEGKREKLEKLGSAGLVEVTADVGTSENLLIAAVKKNGRLINIAYTKGSGILHTAVFAEDSECSVEMYVWGDIIGTSGRGTKATLAAQ